MTFPVLAIYTVIEICTLLTKPLQATFFEDAAAIQALQEKFPHMPAAALAQFSEHTSAMHQIIAWTALELEGFGASLQHSHYTAGVEDAVKKDFELPQTWDMKAALVFGGLAGEMPKRPEKKPLAETVRVFKDEERGQKPRIA